jgi:L-Ala-D/L-Glu epimerase
MRIRRIDLYLNRQPFRFVFVSLHANRRQASGLLLRMETDTGVVGWGESTPRPYVTGETCEGVCTAIETLFVEPLFSAKLESTLQVMELLAALGHLKSPTQTQMTSRMTPSSTQAGNPSALGAIDLALWDAWGQDCGKATHTFFTGAPLPRPPLSLSIPILPLEQIQSLHPLVAKMGASHFKLVLSTDVKENVARLALLRKLVGDSPTVTVDANGRLSVEQVWAMLPAMRAFGLSAIEQPAPKADLESLQRLRSCLDLAITVDESVCTLEDARRLIDLGLCDVFNLKLSKCGGLLATQKIHSLASRHGIRCQLGSHVGETPILAAGGVVAAQMLPNLCFMEIGSSILDPCAALQPPKSASQRKSGLGLCIETAAVEAHLGPPVLTLTA